MSQVHDMEANRPQILKSFMRRYSLSNKAVAEIICVSPPTVRKYLAHPSSNSVRKVNPSINALLDYIDDYEVDMQSPDITAYVKYSPAEFTQARGDAPVHALAEILGVDKSTIHRWQSPDDYYEPSAPASKMLYLMNIFGWPEG